MGKQNIKQQVEPYRIIDLNGHHIEINDLPDALAEAKETDEWYQNVRVFTQFEKGQQAYWRDMYSKLLVLQAAESRNAARKIP